MFRISEYSFFLLVVNIHAIIRRLVFKYKYTLRHFKGFMIRSNWKQWRSISQEQIIFMIYCILFLQQTIHYLNFKKMMIISTYLLGIFLTEFFYNKFDKPSERIYTSLKWKYNVHYVTAWILNWNLIQELLLVWKEEAQGPHHLPEQQWSLSFDQSSFMKYNYTLDNLVKNK